MNNVEWPICTKTGQKYQTMIWSAYGYRQTMLPVRN